MQCTHTVGSQGEQAGGRTSTGGGTHSGRWAALPGACVPGLWPPLARGSEAGGVSAHPKLYTGHAHPGRTCRMSRRRGMDAPPSCGFLEQEWDDRWARPASWVVTKKKKREIGRKCIIQVGFSQLCGLGRFPGYSSQTAGLLRDTRLECVWWHKGRERQGHGAQQGLFRAPRPTGAHLPGHLLPPGPPQGPWTCALFSNRHNLSLSEAHREHK